MNDIPELEREQARPAWVRLLGLLASDVAVGLILALLVIATLLFASGISKFVYIDF